MDGTGLLEENNIRFADWLVERIDARRLKIS